LSILEIVTLAFERLARFVHVIVRPGEKGYDVDYWNIHDHLREAPYEPGIPVHHYYRGTIQDFERETSVGQLDYMIPHVLSYMNDVQIPPQPPLRKALQVVYEVCDSHYYLDGWKPLFV